MSAPLGSTEPPSAAALAVTCVAAVVVTAGASAAVTVRGLEPDALLYVVELEVSGVYVAAMLKVPALMELAGMGMVAPPPDNAVGRVA